MSLSILVEYCRRKKGQTYSIFSDWVQFPSPCSVLNKKDCGMILTLVSRPNILCPNVLAVEMSAVQKTLLTKSLLFKGCSLNVLAVHIGAEVYISPKNNISARTLKMALHKNPVMHCDRVVIFLHGSQKRRFLCTIEEETHEICTVLSNTLFCLLFHYLKDHLGYFF